ETTQDWAEQTATDHRYITLDTPSWLELSPPQTIDPSLHFSFRFERHIPLPGTFVAQIPQGRAWLSADQTSQAILTAENQLLGDLSAEFPLLSPGHPDKQVSKHSLFSHPKLPPLQSIQGKVAVLAGLTNDMYFHWMFEVLPRLDLLHRSGIDFNEIDGFLVSDRLPFQQETLVRLGIPQSKILTTEQHLHLQATELIVPSYPSTPAWMAPWVCDWLRRVFLSPELATDRQNVEPQHEFDRVYISRAKTANRRVINETELIEFLSPFGFQSITLETLSVQEQASLLSRAKVVISPHGGGLTNTVFCQPGTKIIELFSPHYVYPCYWLISNLMHLDYFYLTGIMPEGMYLSRLFYPDVRLADMLIDLQQLQAVLDRAGIQ
ncbi:MAG TPA: glycosyltransferase family 61 protein, partial [Allocoleopsis sp.]